MHFKHKQRNGPRKRKKGKVFSTRNIDLPKLLIIHLAKYLENMDDFSLLNIVLINEITNIDVVSIFSIHERFAVVWTLACFVQLD